MPDLVITNATVWTSPDDEPLPDHAVVVHAGVVERVVPTAALDGAVADLPVWDAVGRVVTAGFWNCHVHLSEPVWRGAGRAPVARLQAALDDMLLSRGFTTAVDLASNSRDTLPLVARIASGELAGPTILSATEAIRPARGLPFYTREEVPWFLWWALPTPWTAAGARRVARRQLRKGARVIKLFTGSYVERDRIKPMGIPHARAAVEVAHEHGVLVFAHTSNREGLQVALDAGVDVIAHVPDETDGTEPLLREAANRGVWLVPTLLMFAETVTTSPAYLDPIDDALRVFRDAGGRVLFGTDVGYLQEYAIDGELAALERCGLDGPAVLRALTTEPAAAFGRPDEGTVAPGMRADLTVLETRASVVRPGDLGRVAAVVKDGRVVLTR
ncbi:amidohydrolase family protein [Nocardioides mangrovi]|uniref:Amidohydrolase family protein n=1 Tax=Nocardioides mangrovi TaxID=2874580 RepID=A0ABS7UE13_9ACTN|nr:amidohydrolase family protein [Nocardioides mangrovi]MBZ5738882.1 amidohydrolase family protein [Nocardioides mangrovi]